MVTLPTGWGLTQLAFHEHKVDATGGIPFAGTIVVQLRLDAEEGTTADELKKTDLALFQKSFDRFELLDEGTSSIGPIQIPRLEYTLRDPDHAQEIQQMVLYFTKDDDIYSLTASQRPRSFARVKEAALKVVGDLIGGGS